MPFSFARRHSGLVRQPAIWRSRASLLVALLGLTFVLAAVLAYEAHDAARSHRVTAERDYMRLHVGTRSWLIHRTIGKLEDDLDPALFIRVHRSVILRRDSNAALDCFNAALAVCPSHPLAPVTTTLAGRVWSVAVIASRHGCAR